MWEAARKDTCAKVAWIVFECMDLMVDYIEEEEESIALDKHTHRLPSK